MAEKEKEEWGETVKVAATDNSDEWGETVVVDPKSNAPSPNGGGSGAQNTPYSSSESELPLSSWTTEANPLKNSKPTYEPSNFGQILEKSKIGVINPDLDEVASKSKPMNVDGVEVSIKGGEAPPMALNVPKKEVDQDIDLLTKRTNVVRKMREVEIDKANQFKLGLEQLQQKGQQLNEEYKANPTPELEAELNQTVKDLQDTEKAYNRAAFAQDVYEKRILQTSDSIKKLANDKVSDNFYKGVYQGMKGNVDSWGESYDLATLGKAEQIQFAKDMALKAPTQEASGGGGVGEMIGGVIPDVLTAIGFSLAGQPVAGAATVAVRQGAQQGAQDFVRAFNEAKQGIDDGNGGKRIPTDDEAYDIATKAAGFGTVTGAVEGLVGVMGGGKVIGALAGKAKTAGGKVIAEKVLDASSDAVIAGGLQAGRNAFDQYQGLDTKITEGVAENMAGELLLSGGVAAVTTPSQYSAAKRKEATKEVFKAVEESKSNPYELQKLQSNLDVLKNQGMISEVDYNELNKKAEDYIKVVETIPTEVKDKQKAADLILERDELEAKKENVDKAFQKPIDEKINAINDELAVLATPKKLEEKPILIQKFFADKPNENLTDRQIGSVEKAIALGIEAGKTGNEIYGILNGLGFAPANVLGGSSELNLREYLNNRVDGTDNRTFQEVQSNKATPEAEAGENETPIDNGKEGNKEGQTKDVLSPTETAGVVEAAPILEERADGSLKPIDEIVSKQEEIKTEKDSKKIDTKIENDVNIQQPMGERKADVGAVGDVAKENEKAGSVGVGGDVEILNTGHFGASNGTDGNHEVKDSNSELVSKYGNGTTDLKTIRMFKDKEGNDVDEFHSLPEYKGYRIKTQKKNGGKLVSIHFEAFNVGSNRGGGHGAIVFEVPSNTNIDSKLIDKFIPVVEKYKADNYSIQDGKLRPSKKFDDFTKPDFSLVNKAVEQSLKAEDKAPVTKPEGKSDVVPPTEQQSGKDVVGDEGVVDKPVIKPTFENVAIETRTPEEVDNAKNEIFNNASQLKVGQVIDGGDNVVKVVTDNSIDSKGNHRVGIVTFERQPDGSLIQRTNQVWVTKNSEGKINIDYNPHETGTNSKGERVTTSDKITDNHIDLSKEKVLIEDADGNLVETKAFESFKPKDAPQSISTKPEPVKNEVAKDDLAAKRKSLLNRLVEAKFVSEESKAALKKEGLDYIPKSQLEAEGIAKEVLDSEGIDSAVLLARANEFGGDVNTLIQTEALNRLKELEDKASTPEEKRNYAVKFAELGIELDKWLRKKGQSISAVNYFYKKSPLGIELIERAKRQEEFEGWAKKKDQSWQEFFNELIKEPEFEKVFKENVSAELKKERAEARKERVAKVDKFFDEAIDKFKGGATYSTIIPPKVITLALKGMKKAYHAGEAVAKIIQDAVDFISKEIGTDSWDKDKFRKEWQNKLAEKGKKILSDEEVKLKILDKFRKKLKGLSESEREQIIKKSFSKLVENDALDYADFREIISEVTGRGKLTDAEAKYIRELVNKTNEVDNASKKLREERTQEAFTKYRAAELEAGMAQRELNELLSTKPEIINRLNSIMQLNTLGIPALVNNPIYNLVNQSFLRFPIATVNTMIDYGIAGMAKAMGKDYVRETDVIAAQKEFFNKLGFGAKESLTQFITGLNRMDYTQKEIKGQNIRPFHALKDLSKWVQGKKNLTKSQIFDKALQGTVGIPAEIVARALNLGDKPMRFGAEGAQASVFAKALGLKDIDYKLFIEFPREEAYRKFKAEGLSDAEAAKKADYIRDSIVKEGERATFQQDNMLNDLLNSVFQSKVFGGASSGVGNFVKSLTISPYIKIPSNAYWSYYNIINPEIAILQSMVYGSKAALKNKNPNLKFKIDKDNSSAAKDLREARYWFGHAVVGIATRAVVASMVSNGIFRSSNTKDDTKKEREGEQFYEQQGSINVNKLWAWLKGKNPDEVEDGLLVNNRWFGHWGTVGNTIAKQYEDATPEQKEAKKNFWDAAFGGMELETLKELDQGVFANTAAIAGALENDFGLRRYGANVVNMFTNIIHPAAFAQQSRAELPYYTKSKADKFSEELGNSMLARSSWARKLTGKYPSSKVNIWGEVANKKDTPLMRMFGISRDSRDNFAQPIYNDYRKTENTKFLPPSIKPEINNVKLKSDEATRLEELVGKARKQLVAPYVNDMAVFEGSKKKYSELSDEEKIKNLEILYEQGFDFGKAQFLREYPQYDKAEQTTEEKVEKRKDRTENKALRSAAKRKQVNF